MGPVDGASLSQDNSNDGSGPVFGDRDLLSLLGTAESVPPQDGQNPVSETLCFK
jgi:hypothetical protein